MKNKIRKHSGNAESNLIARESIETALIELMKTKTFEEITITDISRRAGVSRNAYYRNYSCKEDILSSYLQELIAEVTAVLKRYDPVSETKQSWISLLEIVKKFYPQYKLLIDAGYSQKITSEMMKAMNKNVLSNSELYYSNCYWAGAISSVLTEWVHHEMNISIEELAEAGTCLMQEGIKSIVIFGNRC